MGLVGNNLNIPNFMSAASPQALRRLCLLNNIKLGKEIGYTNFQYVNGKWYCWYFDVINIKEANAELTPKSK